MQKFAFLSLVLLGTITAPNVFAQDVPAADCLTANADRPDREDYCFQQAQQAALKATKDRLNKDLQNAQKSGAPQGTPSGDSSTAPAPIAPPAGPGGTVTTTPVTPPPPAPTDPMTTQPQNQNAPTDTTTQQPQNQNVPAPPVDQPVPANQPKPYKAKPTKHPPIQYF